MTSTGGRIAASRTTAMGAGPAQISAEIRDDSIEPYLETALAVVHN